MRLRTCLCLVALTFLLSVGADGREPASFAAGTEQAPQSVNWAYPMGSAYPSPLLYAQGWPFYGYGNPYYGSQYYQPYNQTPHFPYLYFYEQYTREADESRRAADEYEASLAREGKLTGPLAVGAFTTDFLPRSPPHLPLMLDGQAVAPSPSGAPLVIGSGEHTLRIGVRNNSGN